VPDEQLMLPLFQMRTGFPPICPIFGWTTNGLRCNGCKFRIYSADGTYLCKHPGYQEAPGVHFCRYCGIELGPWAEVHKWEVCGGPMGQCLHILYAGMEEA
jgi:predicted amidophosphoribosyltransferase